MLQMQKNLWERYKDKWSPLEPPYARNSILFMIEELGEVIAIIKKRGETEITSDTDLRNEFITELVDVLMYYNDVLLRYEISPHEISEAYKNKHLKNMGRDFVDEHENYLK
jgi:NTP pyrophosphatase (non-canonical NTP hydrolase)